MSRSALGLVGALLMAGSMFLPVWVEYLDPVLGGYAVYVFILDPLGLGLPFWPYPLLRWLGVPLLVAAVLCARRRTRWTWVPVVFLDPLVDLCVP